MISGLLAMYKIIITQRRVTPQLIGERRRGDLTLSTASTGENEAAFGAATTCNIATGNLVLWIFYTFYLSIANSGYKSSGNK